MKIHEYQARDLFSEYDIPVVEGSLARNPEEARQAAEDLGGRVAVKAQVLAGGRGKAGGVKVVSNPDEAYRAAKDIFSRIIGTFPVLSVLVTRAVTIEQEYYLGMTVDRNTSTVTFIVSAAGGVDIEDLAVERPQEILGLSINPNFGIDDEALNSTLNSVFSKRVWADQASRTLKQLYRLFLEKDCSLVEINPYALLEGDECLALDAKVNIDDNALYKHPEMEGFRNPEEYSEDETQAREMGLAFVSMDGDIGCIVNGAGLAMATMDLIRLFGGNPANFLDVGGSSSPEKVLNAFSIIKGNPKVRAILLNIFGGITRCDDIAQGILMAKEKIGLDLPLVIRLIGTNEQRGREILQGAGIEASENLTDAVKNVVQRVKSL